MFVFLVLRLEHLSFKCYCLNDTQGTDRDHLLNTHRLRTCNTLKEPRKIQCEKETRFAPYTPLPAYVLTWNNRTRDQRPRTVNTTSVSDSLFRFRRSTIYRPTPHTHTSVLPFWVERTINEHSTDFQHSPFVPDLTPNIFFF